MICTVCALLLVLAASPAVACTVRPRATVLLEVAAGHILVTVAINGAPARLVLDTGAARSLVTPAAVQRLGLRLDKWVTSTVMGVGGYERHAVADPNSLVLAGIALKHRTLVHDDTLVVAPIGGTDLSKAPIDGLLGRDFLSTFDLALDLPARTMTLYDVSDCAGRFLPWTVPYTAIAALPAYGDALVIPVQVDGRMLRALPDTGASTSLIGASGMMRLGLMTQPIAPAPGVSVNGVGAFARVAHPYRFATLRVGDVAVQHPEVLAALLHFHPTVDMLLGLDVLRGQRVWLSYATLQVFVAGAR